ncbi:KDGP aldolase, partial [Enterococcus faecalis]
MSLKPNYLEERICLNVLANSVENAQACYEAAEGHVVLG